MPDLAVNTPQLSTRNSPSIHTKQNRQSNSPSSKLEPKYPPQTPSSPIPNHTTAPQKNTQPPWTSLSTLYLLLLLFIYAFPFAITRDLTPHGVQEITSLHLLLILCCWAIIAWLDSLESSDNDKESEDEENLRDSNDEQDESESDDDGDFFVEG